MSDLQRIALECEQVAIDGLLRRRRSDRNVEFLHAWMRAPNPLLAGRTPLQMLKAGMGDKLAAFIEAVDMVQRPAKAVPTEMFARDGH